MITVKIPAAIRVCSPVVCVSEPSVGSDVVGSRGVVKSTEDGEVNVNGWWTPRVCWALDISGPTGAAHLVWWLQTQPKQAKQAAVNAMRIKGLDLLVVAEQAINGMPIDEAGLALLRDYAHRVAGVTL